jgi:hypothetical protein
MKAKRVGMAVLALIALATHPAASESIQLVQSGGVYMLPVRINDAVVIPFVLDTGAAEVVIPADVFSVLRRSGTIGQSDFIGTGTYTLADGSSASSDRYVLHKMVVGNHVIADVVANVSSAKSDPLLGQTFLQKLPAWTRDNARHALVLDADSATKVPRGVAAPTAPAAPRAAALQEIFNADMMNIQVPFLESRVGIARRVFNALGEQIRTYTVDGCDVTAYVKNNNVVAYGLILGGKEAWRSSKENCNVELPVGQHLRTNDLTIGKFINVMGEGLANARELFQSSCIYSCGNAADPTVEFHWDGPHAMGWLKIDLISIIAYGASIDAAEGWSNLMTKAEGKNYVMSAKFNCDGKYQQIGLQLFQNVEVYEIVIRSSDRPEKPYLIGDCGHP